MTEERKKYLASISKEERVIRERINRYRKSISFEKTYLSNLKETPCLLEMPREGIRNLKVLIKALKKQLPAPKKHYSDEVCDYIGCPICYFEVEKDYPCYCLECGQKLR